MIEQFKSIDRGIMKAAVNVKRHIYQQQERQKQKSYLKHKGAVDAKLDFLAAEIIAGEELMVNSTDHAKAKMEARIGDLREERASIVSRLPYSEKQKDLEKLLALKPISENNDSQPEEHVPIPVLTDKEINILNPIVNEGPLNPADAVVLNLKKAKMTLPVGGGATSTTTRTVHSTPLADPYINAEEISYLDSGIEPSMRPKWYNRAHDEILIENSDYDKAGWWDKTRMRLFGSRKYGPFIKSKTTDVIWHDEDGDPTSRTLYVKRQGMGTAALAAGVLVGVAAGAVLGNYYSTREVRANDSVAVVRTNLSDTDRVAIGAAARQAIAEERPAIVRDTATAVAETVKPQIDASIKNAIAETKELTQAFSLDMPIRDLQPGEVMNGNLSQPDQVMKQVTGKEDQSSLRGMADYLVMRVHRSDLGLTQDANPYNGQNVAKLESYKRNPVTDLDYQAEVKALENQIVYETMQRYPGRPLFFWEKTDDGRDILVMRHYVENNSIVQPVYPNDKAAAEITEHARIVARTN